MKNKIYEVDPKLFLKPLIIDNNNKKTNKVFTTANLGDYFIMKFDEIFKRDSLNKSVNIFEMTAKRSFKNSADEILKTYEELFLDKKGNIIEELEPIFFYILKFKADVDKYDAEKGTGLPYDEFNKMLDKFLDSSDELLIRTIDKFVENNYVTNLDELTEKRQKTKKKINEEIMITDKMGKNITKSAYLIRFLIPIISVYFSHNRKLFVRQQQSVQLNDDEDTVFETANIMLYQKLINRICGEKDSVAIFRKLWKLVSARIQPTEFKDNKFWSSAKNMAITIASENNDIQIKLLMNGIIKINCDSDKNLINFFVGVINKQVDFTFRNKFKYKTYVLKNNTQYDEDEEDLNVNNIYDKADILNSRKDEGAHILQKLNIDNTLEKIAEKFNVGLSTSEIQTYATKITSNPIQEQLITVMTTKYMHDSRAIKQMNAMQYSRLVLLCEKYLRENRFNYLSKIIKSKCVKKFTRDTVRRETLKTMIRESSMYQQLFGVKYHSFIEDIENPLVIFVESIYYSEFVDENEERIFETDTKILNAISKEMLLLLKEV